MERTSRGFREGLRRELPAWQAEGLVAEETARRLAARYGLDGKDLSGPSFLAVYVLGALLVGAGVVSLVAWHWDAMSRTARLLVVGAALVAAHGGALLLARRGRHPRVAHALSFLGSLVFGAGIGLVAQIFQVSGPWYGAFGVFAVGALAAGILLESRPTATAAAASGLLLWANGYAHDHHAGGVAATYAIVAVLLGLAWRFRCQVLLAVTGVGAAVALASPVAGAEWIFPPLTLAAAFAAFPLAARGEAGERLGRVAGTGGRLGAYVVLYAVSFSDAARDLLLDGGMSAVLLAATLPAAVVAAGFLARGFRREDVDPLVRGEAMLLAATVPAVLAGLSLRTELGAVLVANLALAFLAVGRTVRGLSLLQRLPFWEGIAVASVVLVSRFFEIERLLWLKGAAFIACGVLVTAAAIAFEKRLARKSEPEVVHAP